MYRVARGLLFRLDPEIAHSYTLRAVQFAGSSLLTRFLLQKIYQAPARPVQVFGLKFNNPVGLAAGYDKDGVGWRGLACLGFGHIEVGTVTLKPQPGNPKPRIFRLPADRAVINRMGFPGEGAKVVARHLAHPRPEGLILGVNLGKNKDTPLDEAVKDYTALVNIFAPLADYLAINVSSPNTVGLRRLQARDLLETLLGELQQERHLQEQKLGKKVPLLVKLAPDLSDEELGDALMAILGAGMDGVIATNTTVGRDRVQSSQATETGGLSGAPLTIRSRTMVGKIIQRSENRIPVIGVGGIMTPDDARAMFDVGASLVQLYTGLIYAGPGLVRKTIKEIP